MSANYTNGSLVIVDPNTPNLKVYWQGVLVPGVKNILIDTRKSKMTFFVEEEGIYSDLRDAGIEVKGD